MKINFRKIKLVAELKADVVPVVIQDVDTKDVLILGYANQEALDRTLSSKKATLWSTSRNELWEKGLPSGNFLEIVEVKVNCEENSLLYLVKPKGSGACHTKDENGEYRISCFYRSL